MRREEGDGGEWMKEEQIKGRREKETKLDKWREGGSREKSGGKRERERGGRIAKG